MTEVTETPQIPTAELRLIPEKSSTEAILAKLKPRQVESEEGSRYTIYTFESRDGKPVEILFYSPNELPTMSEVVKGKNVVINGDDPRWRTTEEWENFSLKMIGSSANAESAQPTYYQGVEEAINSGRGFLMVETSPKALLETAEQLDLELDETLKVALADLREGKLNETSLGIIDSVLAGSLIDDFGEFKKTNQHEGEALFLLYLKGDKNAQQLLTAKREAIQEVDKKRETDEKLKFAEQRRKDKESRQRALELKKLVAVHATRYLPRKSAGGFEIVSTFEGSGWEIPRDTIHFALNHQVEAHMYGSWENAPYVVISPFDKMIGINGKPTVLNTVDTFWEIGPGKRLQLPEGTAIVRSDDLPKGEIISGVETNDVCYKASGLKPEDIAALLRAINKEARDNLNHDIDEIIVYSFSPHPLIGEIEVPTEQIESLIQVTGIFENYLDILKDLSTHSVENVLANILNMSNIRATDGQRQMIANKIRERMVGLIKRLTVEKKIKQMGYDIHSGGMWAWGDSYEVTNQTTALGAQLEIPVTAHESHVSSEVESAAISGLGVLLKVEEIPDVNKRIRDFEAFKRDIRKRFMSVVSQDTRRMLYITGVI